MDLRPILDEDMVLMMTTHEADQMLSIAQVVKDVQNGYSSYYVESS